MPLSTAEIMLQRHVARILDMAAYSGLTPQQKRAALRAVALDMHRQEMTDVVNVIKHVDMRPADTDSAHYELDEHNNVRRISR